MQTTSPAHPAVLQNCLRLNYHGSFTAFYCLGLCWKCVWIANVLIWRPLTHSLALLPYVFAYVYDTLTCLYTNGSQRKVCGVQNRVACMQKVRWQPQSLTLTQQHHNKCSKLRLQRTSPFFICLHELHAFFRLHARGYLYAEQEQIFLF